MGMDLLIGVLRPGNGGVKERGGQPPENIIFAEGLPPGNLQLTIRLDEDALDWLKGHGKGYQTRINRILRVVMESQPQRTAHR